MYKFELIEGEKILEWFEEAESEFNQEKDEPEVTNENNKTADIDLNNDND